MAPDHRGYWWGEANEAGSNHALRWIELAGLR
jgi:hypothetical protein